MDRKSLGSVVSGIIDATLRGVAIPKVRNALRRAPGIIRIEFENGQVFEFAGREVTFTGEQA